MTLSQSVYYNLINYYEVLNSLQYYLDVSQVRGDVYSDIYGCICHPVFEASVRLMTADVASLINNKINDFT
jgi:hypothetical protein